MYECRRSALIPAYTPPPSHGSQASVPDSQSTPSYLKSSCCFQGEAPSAGRASLHPPGLHSHHAHLWHQEAQHGHFTSVFHKGSLLVPWFRKAPLNRAALKCAASSHGHLGFEHFHGGQWLVRPSGDKAQLEEEVKVTGFGGGRIPSPARAFCVFRTVAGI